MNPLPTTKRMMQWLCMYPARFPSRWRKIARITFASLMFFISGIGILVHVVLIWNFKLTNLEGSLFALMGLVGNISTLYSSIIAAVLRYRIEGILQQLTIIYDASEYLTLSMIYERN